MSSSHVLDSFYGPCAQTLETLLISTAAFAHIPFDRLKDGIHLSSAKVVAFEHI